MSFYKRQIEFCYCKGKLLALYCFKDKVLRVSSSGIQVAALLNSSSWKKFQYSLIFVATFVCTSQVILS